jgi:hypothetical protein
MVSGGQSKSAAHSVRACVATGSRRAVTGASLAEAARLALVPCGRWRRGAGTAPDTVRPPPRPCTFRGLSEPTWRVSAAACAPSGRPQPAPQLTSVVGRQRSWRERERRRTGCSP